MTSSVRGYRVQAPKAKRFQTEPWAGVDDGQAAFPNAMAYASLAQNCVLRDVDRPDVSYVGVPGFSLLGGQLGSVGVRTIQAIGGFTKLNGVSYRVCVAGGKFYTYDYGGNAWTETLTSANITASGATALSTTATVSLLAFANELIVSDGISKPWSWDGTNGGGVTYLSNAPICRGPLWGYYGCWFAVKDTAPNTMVWSEVGLLNTGFEAGGYNNAWDMRQTSSEAIVGGIGTNDYLVVLRENSITLVRGEVTNNFSSTGTREAIGEGVGSKSPYSTIVQGADVYFLAADTRIMRIRGGELEDVSGGLRQTLSAMSRTQIGIAQSVSRDFEGQGERLVFGFPQLGQTALTAFAYINPDTGRAEGVQTGFQAQRLGTFKDSAGFWVMVHGGGATASASADGYVYGHELPSGTVFDYQLQAGTASIAHAVRTSHFGFDVAFEHRWWRGDVAVVTESTLSGVAITVTTSRGDESFATMPTLTSGGSMYGVGVYDTATYGGATGERHLMSFRPASQGRWAQVTVAHAAMGEHFRLEQIALAGVPLDARSATY